MELDIAGMSERAWKRGEPKERLESASRGWGWCLEGAGCLTGSNSGTQTSLKWELFYSESNSSCLLLRWLSAMNIPPLWTRLALQHVFSFLGCFCALSKSNTINRDWWRYKKRSEFPIQYPYNGQNNHTSVCPGGTFLLVRDAVSVSIWPRA